MAVRLHTTRLSVQGAQQYQSTLREAGQTGQNALDRVSRATQPASRGLRVVSAAGVELRNSLQGAASGVPGIGRLAGVMGPAGLAIGAVALAAGALGKTLSDVVKSGEQLRLLEGQFQALTGSAERGAQGLQNVLDVTRRTGTTIDGVAAVMSRFTLAAGELGRSDDDVAQLTENVLNLGRLGGSSVADVTNASVQLAQALGSGVLQGDELRSILESMPLVAQAIADKFGVSIGELRELGREGRLVADDVFQAILDKTGEIDGKIGALPSTVEQASNRMALAWTVFTAEIDRSIKSSETLAGVMNAASEALERLVASGAQAQAFVLNDLTSERDRLRSEIADLETNDARYEGALPGEREKVLESKREALAKLTGELRAANEEQERLVRGAPPAARLPAPIGPFPQRLEEPDRPGPGAVRAAPSPRSRPFRTVDIDADLDTAASSAGRAGGGGGGGRVSSSAPDRDEFAEALARIRERTEALRFEAETAGMLAEKVAYLEAVRRLEAAATADGTAVSQEERLAIIAEATAQAAATSEKERATQAARDLADAQTDARRRAEDLRGALDEMSRTAGGALGGLIAGTNSWRDALGDVLQVALRIAEQQLMQPGVQNSAGGFVSSLIGGLFGGGFAQGAAFHRGQVVPFASGGIVTSPTAFPMSGGRTGLMGEAGPEGILPLVQTASGALGVRTEGGGTSRIVVELSPALIGQVLQQASHQSVQIANAAAARTVGAYDRHAAAPSLRNASMRQRG